MSFWGVQVAEARSSMLERDNKAFVKDDLIAIVAALEGWQLGDPRMLMLSQQTVPTIRRTIRAILGAR